MLNMAKAPRRELLNNHQAPQWMQRHNHAAEVAQQRRGYIRLNLYYIALEIFLGRRYTYLCD